MIRENRWFTKSGKAKRVSSDVSQWKSWAIEHKNDLVNGDSIALTKSLREQFGLGLTDAANLMVFLVGCYSNAAQYGHGHITGELFRSERYNAGKLVSESLLKGKAFNIRTLELV